MKQLLLLLGLIAIAYPLEVSARDLVRVADDRDGVSYYVWKDSIDKRGKIVWWRDEEVYYDNDGNLKKHFISDYSGDCQSMSMRVQKFYNQITGESALKSGQLRSPAPQTPAYSILK
jgi:hypothetical protein